MDNTIQENTAEDVIPSDVTEASRIEEEIRNSHTQSIVNTMREERGVELYPLEIRFLKIHNFGCYDDIEIDFVSQNRGAPMTCLVGPNGFGKTTLLNAIQLLFMNYDEYESDRYENLMLKNVRNWHDMAPKEQSEADFVVAGTFFDGIKEYSVIVTRKNGYTQHPPHIMERIQDYCFSARFDQELNTFQIARDKWPQFQQFFSGVTGFEVEEDVDIFSFSEDPRAKRIMQQFVTGFTIKKPREIIKHRQCSAGERKIAKCFSTILNRSVTPKVILIDNVTDHVDNSRHIPIVESIEKCFPNSQLVVTCHSVPIQRYLGDRSKVIDMRFLYVSDLLRQQAWRIRYMDEIGDMMTKLTGSFSNKDSLVKEHLILLSKMNMFFDLLGKEENLTSDTAKQLLRTLAADAYAIVAENYTVSYPVRIQRLFKE